jgi:hypothetical protein
VHEHELVGTLKLKPHLTTLAINLSLAKAEGVEEQKELDDHCKNSKIEGIAITGGEPGKVEFKKIVISGCEEALAERCTVASPSETATLENVKGELAYVDGGSGVGILFKLVEYTLGLRCKGHCPEIENEKIKTEFLPDVGPTFAYSEFPEDTFSPLFLEYLSNPKSEKAEIHNSGKGPVEANRVGYEFGLLQELEGASSEDKEIKAE